MITLKTLGIENSDVYGNVFDITNSELDNNTMDVDTVIGFFSFCIASNTKEKTLSMTFNNNDVSGNGFKINDTFNNSTSKSKIGVEFIKVTTTSVEQCNAVSTSIMNNIVIGNFIHSQL